MKGEIRRDPNEMDIEISYRGLDATSKTVSHLIHELVGKHLKYGELGKMNIE